MAQKATIKDVAERAGCGVATVSRVLNKSGPASSKVRTRVLEAADALNFQFNDLGRSLRSRRTRTLGCLVPSIINPVFANAVQKVQEEALAAGYHLLLMCSDYSPDLEEEAVRMLLQKAVEGMVLTVSDVRTSRALDLLRAHQVRHCLMFNTPEDGEPAYFVDNDAASWAVAEAFSAAGHQYLGFVALRFSASDRSRQRFEGFRAACASLGMAEPVLLEIDETPDDLNGELQRLLFGNRKLTGLFASNDFLGLAAMKSARQMGRRIPEDLSVVGFDGIAIGELVDPPLTTVVTDPRRMGEGAIRAVIRAIEDKTAVEGGVPPLPFEIRRGGSLGSHASDVRDGGEAATSPPSHHHPA